MTPEQFEHFVAKIYEDKGYETQVSPLSNDWGIDVIAIKEDQKIAIQVKKYGGTTRKVNRRVMMELYGAAAYQECTSSVLATDGEIMPDAIEVAKKIKIEILRLPLDTCVDNVLEPMDKNISEIKNTSQIVQKSGYPTFDKAWQKYIVPLKGKEIMSDSLKNTIIEVSTAEIIRKTSRGKINKIAIEGFRLAYNELLAKKTVTRELINQKFDQRCSSGIVLVLGQIPFIEITSNPKGLKLKNWSCGDKGSDV